MTSILLVSLASSACSQGEEPVATDTETLAETKTPAETKAPVISGSAPSPPLTQAAPPVTSSAVATKEATETDPVVALVNGVPISAHLLESQLIMSEAGQSIFSDKSMENESNQEAHDLALKLEVLNGLIALELAAQEALTQGYGPSQAELEEALVNLQNDFEEPGQLYKSLDQYGQTMEELRQNLIKTLALQKWQENGFLSQMVVTEDEARTFYNEHMELASHPAMVRASQIFFGVPLASQASTRKEVRTKSEQALARLKSGQDFQTVARELSDDPEAKRTGGDMGWLAKDSTLPFFSSTLFTLKPGETSQLLESPLGFHIFKVLETKKAGISPFEAMRANLVEHLSTSKFTAAMTHKVETLFNQADIKIYDQQLKQDFTDYRKAITQLQTKEKPEGNY